MSCVEECISERECRKFEEGLNSKGKLATFGKNVVMSGMYGLNEELEVERNVLCVVLSVRA